MVAGVLEWNLDLAADLFVNRLRNTKPTLGGQTLQTGRDIDSVTKEVVLVDDDISEIDSDPEEHLAISRNIGVSALDLPLDVDGTSHRLHRAGKLGEDAVTGTTEDSAMMVSHELVDHAAVGVEPADAFLFVRLHQPAEADDISRQDRGKLARYPTGRLT